MNNAVTIANYFLKKSFEEGVEVTPMKLLKLVYIAHGWHLAITDTELISEPTEVWKYGPVVPSVYHAFKRYGTSQIRNMELLHPGQKTEYTALLQDQYTSSFLDKIWDVHKDYTGGQLSHATHQHDTPWYETWNIKHGKVTYGAIIPNNSIKEYYKKRAGNKS